jgi:hypothetical protein
MELNKSDTVQIFDKEDVTISQIIEAKLNKDGNKDYIYLEEYATYLSSQLKPKKFRVKNFEDITEFAMKDKKNPLDYLFECYHRSIELIEIKPKQEYDDSYKELHRLLAYYIGTTITQPEILEIKLDINARYNSMKKYLKTCDINELGYFIYDIEKEIGEVEKTIELFFGLLIG